MQSLPKARPVQDLSVIDGTCKFIMTAFVMVILAFAFNAHSQEPEQEIVTLDRIAGMAAMPRQERCQIIAGMGMQGGKIRAAIALAAWAPDDGIDAMMDATDETGLAEHPGYTVMTDDERIYRRAHTERGWNIVDGWISENPDYMTSNDNNIPHGMLDEVWLYIMNECMLNNFQ